MNKIQDLWAEDYGSVLQMKIVNPISSEIFDEVVEYLQQVDVVEVDASRHLFYIQDKYIFIFYSALNHNPNAVLDKIKNHFRTCKNTLHLSDYELAIIETDKVGDCFNDWLLKLIVKTQENECVLTKSCILAKDYIYDFNKDNSDLIGKLKIEKKIEKLTVKADKDISAVNEIVNENIIIYDTIEKENIKLQKLIDDDIKRNGLMDRIREKKAKGLQTIIEIKDKQSKLIQNIEKTNIQNIQNAIREFCEITNNKNDCISKKAMCDMLELDNTNQKDMRPLVKTLKEYGVKYDGIKSIACVRGAFVGIKLL